MPEEKVVTGIRRDVSNIIGELIGPGQWEQKLNEAEQKGRIGIRELLDITIALCKYIEEHERKLTTSDGKAI